MDNQRIEIDYSQNENSSKNKRKKKLFYENVKAYIKEYCEVSSIQGLAYLIKDISLFERCWWIIVLVICVGGCTNMIYEVCNKWIDTPVLVSLATKDTPIHKVPFPAVTICPESKISRQCVHYSKVLRLRKAGDGHLVTPQENEYFDNMALLCRADNHKNSTSNRTGLNDYADFLNKCKSVDLSNSHCKFAGRVYSCSDILQPIITDEGLCYSFNMFDVRDIYSDVNQMTYLTEGFRDPEWDVDTGYPEDINGPTFYPFRVLGSGAKSSLVVVLLTKREDVYYSCRDFALQGMRVSLHMPARIPRPNQVFFPVGLNELVVSQVTPTYMGTTPKIRDYDPEKRNCFFGKERKLKYFRVYTQSNCNLECWTNYTIQECGCVHFYMPRDANTSICSLSQRQCLQTASETYAVSNFPRKYHKGKQSKGNLNSDCDCLPICSDLNYNAEISRGKWNWDDPNGANVGDLKKYFKDYHASAVKVFFKSSYFLPTEKSELYGVVDFLSNTGGILGLFTGFSLFSLVEIIYFLSVRLIENYRRFGYWAGQREH